jgi:hypothetical protein
MRSNIPRVALRPGLWDWSHVAARQIARPSEEKVIFAVALPFPLATPVVTPPSVKSPPIVLLEYLAVTLRALFAAIVPPLMVRVPFPIPLMPPAITSVMFFTRPPTRLGRDFHLPGGWLAGNSTCPWHKGLKRTRGTRKQGAGIEWRSVKAVLRDAAHSGQGTSFSKTQGGADACPWAF